MSVVYVTDAPYSAVGDGVANDSAAIMSAINANKGGTIVLPAGRTFLAAGLILQGSSYDGTRIEVEGTLKMLPNPSSSGSNFQNAMYVCVAFQGCDGCSIAVTGALDGNRLAQPASQQHHLVCLAGVTNFQADDGWTVREVRGDGFTILRQVFSDPSSSNSDTVYIGNGVGTNSAHDGRNLVSVISGENVTIGNCISRKIGGVIAGERMPGGFDCEPDHNVGHLVRNLIVGFWNVETVGTSGFAFIGASQSGNEAARDWNIINVRYAGAIVHHTDTTGLIGGPIIRRVTRIAGGEVLFQRASRNLGVDLDQLDWAELSFTLGGVSGGAYIGFSGWVYDSDIKIGVTDFSASAVVSSGVGRSRINVSVREPQGVGSYGLNLSAGNRSIVQTGVQYVVDCAFTPLLSIAVRGGGVAFGSGTAVVGGSLLGYPDHTLQLASIDANVIRTENVQGRNYAGAVPTTGTWAKGDFVRNSALIGGGTPGWHQVGVGAPDFKAAASVAA